MDTKLEEYLSISFTEGDNSVRNFERFEKMDFEIHVPYIYQEAIYYKRDKSDLDEIRVILQSCYLKAITELKLSNGLNFLDYHFQKYQEKDGNDKDFLEFVHESVSKIPEGKEARKQAILEWIAVKKKESNQLDPPLQMKREKDKRYRLPQQMLLLHRTGILKYLDKYNLTAEKKALLISKMLGSDHKNTKEYLRTISLVRHQDTCNTKKNNDLIDQLFSELNISDHV